MGDYDETQTIIGLYGTMPPPSECRAGAAFRWPSVCTPAGPAGAARTVLCGAPAQPGPPCPGGQRDLPVYPGGPASSVALRHLPHADQRVRPAPQHQLLQVPDLGQVLLLRRLEDPLPQPPYVLLVARPVRRSPSRGSSSGPFTVIGVQLALRFRRFQHTSSSKAHPPHVSTLSRPGTRPVSGQLSRAAAGERDHAAPVSRCLSAAGIRFLGILFPPGSSASLTVGLPAALHATDPDGVSTFRTHETRPGRAPSIPRGRRCPHDRASVPGRRLPLLSGQPLHPGTATHRRGSP